MKKARILATALCLCAAISASYSQNNDDEIVIEKGSSLINVYYGPMLLKSVYKNAAAAGAVDLTFKSVGPIGLVYEYLVMEELGIGAEIGYSQLTMTYQDVVYNSAKKMNETYTDEWKFTTTRLMLRVNYHFVEDKHMDVYALVSTGYRGTTFTFKTTDPSGTASESFPGLIPFGVKLGAGFRYYFVKNVGVNLELALGTPVIGGGLSFKF